MSVALRQYAETLSPLTLTVNHPDCGAVSSPEVNACVVDPSTVSSPENVPSALSTNRAATPAVVTLGLELSMRTNSRYCPLCVPLYVEMNISTT